MARTLDEMGKKCQSEGEAKNGPMKNWNSKMPEDNEKFISLTLRTRNSKKSLRMLARNWKHQWSPLCLARQARRVSMERPVVKPMTSNLLEERVYARCPQHMSTITNEAQPQRVGALLPMPSCLGIGGYPSGSRQGHPRYTGARSAGRPWVARTNAPRAKYRLNDACTRQHKTQVRPTNMVAEQVAATD